MVDAALAYPDDTVREAVYLEVPGGTKTLTALAKELKATERVRWKRQTNTRWDERRATVYAEYEHSVIRCVTMARRIAASRGLCGSPHP
ncbi:hypothetical protein [Actinomadura sp. 6N118]|uniref:hypothetical protein n=1 Tax=Actinomadura sp. 6N118 TaxID=3375151 RepID=UPI003791B103